MLLLNQKHTVCNFTKQQLCIGHGAVAFDFFIGIQTVVW